MGNNQCSQIYRFHIFNCEDGGYGCFFFFSRKNRRSRVCITVSFFAKKKKYKAGKTGSRFSCTVF